MFLTATVALILAVFAWRRHLNSISLPFIFLSLAVAQWTFFRALQAAVVEIPAKILWAKFAYVGIAGTPLFWLIFILRYSQQFHWLTRRHILAASILPFLTVLIAATNEQHNLLWSSFTPDTGIAGDYLIFHPGPWFVLFLIYSYSLIFIGVLVLLRMIRHAPKIYRHQAVGLLFGALIAWSGNIIYLSETNPWRGVELTPLTIAIACIIYVFIIFRYQLLDLMPMARDVLIENMNDGVIVLDAHNRIVDLNPAARRLIGDAANPSQTNDVEEALNKRFDLVTRYKNVTTEARDTIGINEDPPRYYDARITPLRDKDGHLTGRMIVLRDVSNLKQIEIEVLNQAQLVAQRLAELETIHDISQASASRLKVNALLEFVGEKILQTFKVQGVYIALHDKQENVFRVPYWQVYDERLNRAPVPFGQGLSGIIFSTKQPLVINNNYEQRSTELGVVRVPNSRGSIPKAWVGVPMIVGDEVIGILSAQDYHNENVFTDETVRLLTTIAANFGIAFQNAQLYEAAQQRAAELQDLHKEAEERVKELASINAIGQAAASQLEMGTLFELVGKKIYQAFDVEAVYIALYDQDTGLIHLPYWDSPQGQIGNRTMRLGEGLTSVIISSGQPLLIDHDYIPRSAELGVSRMPNYSGGLPKSWLGVPMRLGDKIIGVISVQDFKREYAFTPADIRLLATIAANVGIAIQNAQLYKATQQRETEVRHANEQLRVQLTEIEALQAQLREQAIRDPLTGLFNRRYLIETLDREVAQAVRASTPLSIIMIDLDRFKKINDTYGHKAGDVMLQTLGTLLATKTR
ncbi:MAG: GAF domain-containing protein, partial [Chloroflexi bacterium]|nr:GAF domain-containing protein [Chloroflexota bacterium]